MRSASRATPDACPRPEVGPTEGSRVLGCAQHRAARTMTPCGVAIADAPSRWRCGALRALEGSLPRTVADCVRTLRSAAVAVTGDHAECCRPLFLVGLASCVTRTGWPSSAAGRSLVPAVRLPRCAWSRGRFGSSAAMPGRRARARSHRRPATLLGAPRLLCSLSRGHRAIRTRSAARSGRTYEPPGVVRR